MADLLSPQDYQDPLNAFYDLEDTFHKYKFTLVKRVKSFSKFNDGRKDSYSESQTEFRGLFIAEKTGEDAEINTFQKGKVDFSEGYINVFYRELSLNGLIDENNNPTINPNNDTMLFQGKEYDIFGVNINAPWNGDWVLAKIHIKKAFTKGDKTS